MSDSDAQIETQAAGWVVKTLSGNASEAEMIAMTEWLEAAPRHADAYREALTLWGGTGAPPPSPSSRPRGGSSRPRLLAVWGAGLAAAVIAAGFIVLPGAFAPAQLYETRKGERREVVLGDGTHLSLNTDTRLTVRGRGRAHTVWLDKGEVAIAVTHRDGAPAHPLRVLAGDLSVTDVGTVFNVRRTDGQVGVSVREGRVDMTEAGQTAHLRAGDYGLYSGGRSQITQRDPAEAFAWQSSHAIYRDQPLSAVAADLNRYYDKPIIVEGDAGQLRLTAILTLDSQSAVAGRLTEYLPLDVRTTTDAIYLSRRRVSGG